MPRDLHGQIERAARQSSLTLHLFDGQTVWGQFDGFIGDWSDTTASAIRYEAWRQAQPAGVPGLGDPVFVRLASGETLKGSFEGVGRDFIAIAPDDSRHARRVGLDAIMDAGCDSGGSVLAWADLAPRLQGAPPVVGVGLRHGSDVVIVDRESISSVAATGAVSPRHHAPVVVKLVAAGATIALVAICCTEAVRQVNRSTGDYGDSFSACAYIGSSGVKDRPFGASNVSAGLEPWPPGETHRP